MHGMDYAMPYVFVVDDAFALSTCMLKHFPGLHTKGSKERVFNYRLSRARRVVENVFGIMSSVFRVLRKPMFLQPEKVSIITLTCCFLHNFLRNSKSSRSNYTPSDAELDGEFYPGTWRRDQENMTSLLPLRNKARNSSIDAKNIREAFGEYFMNKGKVPWQDKYC